jgi:predicted RNA-binding protein with PUA-like domain
MMKSEPGAFSIDDLKRKKTALWDGVRNYQARNFMMKDMQLGDEALFYHSNANPSAAVGVMVISGTAEPDPTQFDPQDSHYDPKATPGKPIWYCVRVTFKSKFKRAVSLQEMRSYKVLQRMVLLKKGSRLSIQPVTKTEFEFICDLGSKKAPGRGKR